MGICPECEFDEIDTSDLEEGDTVRCPECGTDLALNATGELDLADDEDDLDDDEDDDEEDEDEDEDDLDDDEDE
jgi:hypothetical protein